MTDDEWATFSMLLDKGFKWREPFGEAHAFTYRTLLDGYDSQQISDALRALIAQGQKFGPTPGEIIEQIRKDPLRPTFDEALKLVERALRAANLPLQGEYSSEAQMIQARHENVLKRASGMHPLVASFVGRRDIGRLRDEIGELDGRYGGIRRQELEQAWEAHCEAQDGREVAAITGPRRGELGSFDPLSWMSGPPRQLNSGTGA